MQSALTHSERSRSDRRSFLLMSAGACALTPLIPSSFFQLSASLSRSLTKQERDSMTPAQVIDELKKGNERFRTGKMTRRDYLAEQRASAKGQYPAAVILGCLDSRVPAEIVFDTGIGDTFIGRVAGNVVNDDLLGSMEFGCAVAGAKVILVLGHTACGAIKGTIDDVELGNLTGLLARIKPAVTATKFEGEKSSKNYAYVDAVAETNVRLTVNAIHRRSPTLEDLAKKGTIAIVGAMYDVATERSSWSRRPDMSTGRDRHHEPFGALEKRYQVEQKARSNLTTVKYKTTLLC